VPAAQRPAEDVLGVRWVFDDEAPRVRRLIRPVVQATLLVVVDVDRLLLRVGRGDYAAGRV